MALSCCKKLSALFIGITSKHDGDFYCLNCFCSYSTENNLKKKYVKIMIIAMKECLKKIIKY